ncbi:MAG: YraN family protein [Polyangiaceae bacterium]|jgi:putative endonuclease|nr:YraN family protein [Polyangiaceae bacterium]
MASPRARAGLRCPSRLGREAEDAVAAWLEQRGWHILARNLRVGRLEIDLLARCGDLAAVIEVRRRGAGSWQGPFESVDARKRTRLREAARRIWVQRFENDPTISHLRIDVAAVQFLDDGGPVIQYAAGQWW